MNPRLEAVGNTPDEVAEIIRQELPIYAFPSPDELQMERTTQ
jgi:hypothetical protein